MGAERLLDLLSFKALGFLGRSCTIYLVWHFSCLLDLSNVCREKGLLLNFVTNLVQWHAGVVGFLLSDVILA
jgi:hypothetical protein